MSFIENNAGEGREPALQVEMETGLETEIAQALRHFKQSVDAWSEAASSRPRTVASAARHSWRLAAGWALGCVLAAGSLAGAVYERRHQQDLSRIAAMKTAAQKVTEERAAAELAAAQVVHPAAAVQRPAAALEPAKNRADAGDENLLATVDSDVSRQVPAAMEPLAQLMDDNGTE